VYEYWTKKGTARLDSITISKWGAEMQKIVNQKLCKMCSLDKKSAGCVHLLEVLA